MLITKHCRWCKKRMRFFLMSAVQDFCSKACYGKWCQYDAEKGRSGPDMPPLDKDSISDEGYAELVGAIVKQAKDDVLKYSPQTPNYASAVNFFKSAYFEALTGMDGKTTLKKLLEDKKTDKKTTYYNQGLYIRTKCRCIETGVVYNNLVEAAAAYGRSPRTIFDACRGSALTAAGMHWECVEDKHGSK